MIRPSWHTETGHLACIWSEAGQYVQYNPKWMRETLDAPSGYLPPLPDFVSRSPFGGVSWFQPHSFDRDS